MRRSVWVALLITIGLLAPGAASSPAPPVPAQPTANRQLWAVSCSAPSSCTAVGDYVTPSGLPMALAERFSGSSWQLQSVPLPTGTQATDFHGVSFHPRRTASRLGVSGSEV